MAPTAMLVFLADNPSDDALWLVFAQQLAEDDHIEEAAFFRRDYGMIRRLLMMGYNEIASIRTEARKVSPYCLELIDTLTPLIRRAEVRRVQKMAEPPPLPGRKA